MAKQLLYTDDARKKLLAGAEKLAQAVGITLGPTGRNVIIDKSFGGPTVTKDGVTVCKEIDLPDPFENMGAKLVNAVAQKTSDVADVSEKQRQISTQTSLLHATWMDKKFNIMDTPGYLDFMSEALAALHVADFALVIVHAQHGIGVGTERVSNFADECGIPKIIVINAMDKQNANFDKVLADARAHYGPRVFPLNMPVNPGPDFNQILDVLRSDIVTYETTGRGRYTEEPAHGIWKDRVLQLHRELIELIAESDDALLTKFFDQGGLSEEEFRNGIHAAVQQQHFIPLFCISAETDVGVARLMDFIAKYGSSPVDRAKVSGDSTATATKSKSRSPVQNRWSQVFKTMNEEHFGELSFFRVYSGTVRTGMELYNSTRGITERIGQIYLLNGRDRSAVGELISGDIGATVKLKDTHTGNTLCLAKRPVKLPAPDYPKPSLHAALQPKSQRPGGQNCGRTCDVCTARIPRFSSWQTPNFAKRSLLRRANSISTLSAERLRRRFNVHFDLVEPRVRFRETIKASAEADYRHKKQSGGAGQFAEVLLRITPASAGFRHRIHRVAFGPMCRSRFCPFG